jgi:hypothetical protein
MIKQIFPILGFLPSDKSQSTLKSLGTGFFINNKGNFLTVAHNFKKIKDIERKEEIEHKHFAFIEQKLMDLEILYSEYNRDVDQKNVYKDLAIGKLKVNNEFKVYKPKSIDQKVLAGFSIRKLNYPMIEEITFKEHTIFLYEIPISSTGNDLIYNNVKLDSFKNVLFFEPSDDFYGLSGCPVFYINEIIGILSSKCFITQNYFNDIITSKLQQ